MAASSTVRVSILGDASSLTKAFQEGEKGAKGFGDKMAGAGKAMSLGVTAPLVAGAAVAVKAASEEQAEVEKLAGAIRTNLPGATEEAIAANEDWITSMQNASGVADTELRNSIQQLVQAGVPLEEAQKQTAAAMDIAAAKGVPLATVTNALVKANNGNTTALGRLVGKTKDASGEALTMEEIMARAADTMGGAAATAADTAAGRTAIMQAKMGDLSEELGSILLPILEKVVEVLSQMADWFSQLSPGAKKAVVAFGAVAAAIGPVLIVLGKVVAMGPSLIKGFQAVGKAWGILSKLFMANPWILLIAAIIALVILIVVNWDKIKAYLVKAWAWIKDTATAVWNGIKQFFGRTLETILDTFRYVWDTIKSALKTALDFIVKLFLNWTLIGLLIKHWDKIKDGITALKDWIFDTWDSIVDFFGGLPSKIGRAVSGMWDGIKTAFRSAVNWIISKWNDLEISIGGGTILGVTVPKITVRTPNIPSFQTGGTFRAPPGTGSGLALLHDRERVVPAGRAMGGVFNFAPVINAGIGSDPNAIAKAILEALQRYQRINGPLPLDVRLN